LIGSCYALHKKLPLVLRARKANFRARPSKKVIHWNTHATLQIQESDLTPGKKWLIVDDLIATGGTIEAVAKMVKRTSGTVAGVSQ